MSDPLEEEFEEFRPRRSRRARILLFTVLGVIVAFFLVTLFASIYTDRLWYGSVGYSGVYDKMLWTRVGLFFGFGLLMAAGVAVNMVIAYRARPLRNGAPPLILVSGGLGLPGGGSRPRSPPGLGARTVGEEVVLGAPPPAHSFLRPRIGKRRSIGPQRTPLKLEPTVPGNLLYRR